MSDTRYTKTYIVSVMQNGKTKGMGEFQAESLDNLRRRIIHIGVTSKFDAVHIEKKTKGDKRGAGLQYCGTLKGSAKGVRWRSANGKTSFVDPKTGKLKG